MPDTIQPPLLKDEEPNLPHYASYILRCWTGRDDRVRARLFEVHSGVSYPVASLAELPALVRRLVTQALSPASHEDTGQT